MGAACSDNRTTNEKFVDEFIKTLRTKPDTSRFAFSKERQLEFNKGWTSTCFGGSVFNPTGIYGGKRNRKNSLLQDVKSTTINQIYGGGYYVLEKVQQYEEDPSWFFDIYIFCDQIDNHEHLDMVRRENERVRDRLLKKGKTMNTTPRQTEFLQFKDIASSLNGYARFVSYKVNQSH